MTDLSLKRAAATVILGEFSLPNEPGVKISLKKCTSELPGVLPVYVLKIEAFGDSTEHGFVEFDQATGAFLQAIDKQIAFFHKA